MDSISAFAMGAANKDKPLMVFDWDKAAKIILLRGPTSAEAGLARDWEYTGGPIFKDDKPVTDSYAYLASTWATPQICLDGTEYVDCFIMEKDVPSDWLKDGSIDPADIRWPDSALEILNGISKESTSGDPQGTNKGKEGSTDATT